MWASPPALLLVGLMGSCAGAVYVLGFTLIQANTDDELRGRTFATLYTIVRFCLLLSFVIGPLMASLFGNLSRRLLDGRVERRTLDRAPVGRSAHALGRVADHRRRRAAGPALAARPPGDVDAA